MQVKLLLFAFYFNGRLHAVSIGKPSQRISKCWTVGFSKTESKQNFGFPHIPRECPGHEIMNTEAGCKRHNYYYYCHSADSDKFLCIIVGHQVETESLPATNKTHVHNLILNTRCAKT